MKSRLKEWLDREQNIVAVDIAKPIDLEPGAVVRIGNEVRGVARDFTVMSVSEDGRSLILEERK